MRSPGGGGDGGLTFKSCCAHPLRPPTPHVQSELSRCTQGAGGGTGRGGGAQGARGALGKGGEAGGWTHTAPGTGGARGAVGIGADPAGAAAGVCLARPTVGATARACAQAGVGSHLAAKPATAQPKYKLVATYTCSLTHLQPHTLAATRTCSHTHTQKLPHTHPNTQHRCGRGRIRWGGRRGTSKEQ